jgi:carbonic anhydrase
MIRKIGNQLGSNLGDVEYGVRHLNTPLLVVVGHDDCGAVVALSSEENIRILTSKEVFRCCISILKRKTKARI